MGIHFSDDLLCTSGEKCYFCSKIANTIMSIGPRGFRFHYLYNVFISYSRKDSAIIDIIINALNAGGLTYYLDKQGIDAGSDFIQTIHNAISESELFLCVLSENSYNSDFSIRELEYASSIDEVKVLYVIVDNYQLPDDLMSVLRGMGYYKMVRWQFSGNPNIENTIIWDVGHALERSIFNMSKTEKEHNILMAKNRKDGDDNYVPKVIDIDIFISYRRVDGRDYARNIMQALKMMGYSKVFFDYNSLRDGVFNTQIIDAIYSCKDFILVISPLALKNCSREGDWVAKEIRAALKYDKHIIPVVIEDTFKDWPKKFPEDLAAIKDIQFHKLMTDEYFEDSIEKLKTKLTTTASDTSIISLLQSSPTTIQLPQEMILYKVKVNRKCRLLIDDEEIMTLEPAKLTKVPLPKGEYVRKIVDYEDDTNYKEDILLLDQERAELLSL